MKRKKLTPEEAAEVLSKPFEIFPEPSAAAKALGVTERGALDWQKPLFWWTYSWKQRLAGIDTTHACTKSNDLIYSGSGLGKTLGGVALNAFFLVSFPGCNTVTGAETYSDVEQIIIPKLRDLFSVKYPWDHPWVTHIPNKQDKYLELTIPTIDEKTGDVVYKASRAWLTHFSDWERLRGKEYVYAHLEEISQLKEPRIVDEIDRRLRSPIAPFQMMYATTNPPESMSHFLYDKWDLSNYMEDFEGEKPAAKNCRCHLCPKCDEIGLGSFEFGEDGLCSNPECAFIDISTKAKLPPTRFAKPINVYQGVSHPCPGNQHTWRVFRPDTGANIHNTATMGQQLKVGHDAANYDVYVKGNVRALTTDRVYPNYSYAANTNPNPIEVDPTKDIWWTHDHNQKPRCSAIIQEYFTEGSSLPDIRQIDEIVEYETKIPRYDDDTKQRIKGVFADDVTKIFIDRYKEWNQQSKDLGTQRTVYLAGDHTAFNVKQAASHSMNEFQVMKRMLKEAGFKVKLTVIKYEKVKIQINVKDRLAITNIMLRDEHGYSRYKINKNCLHTLKSFADLEKKNNDAEAIDKSVDELARRTTTPNAIHLVSHITDAIGYYIARSFNLVKASSGEFKVMYIGDQLLDIGKDGKIKRRPGEFPKEEKPKKSNPLLDQIRAAMSQDNEESNFSGYFGF